MAINPLRNYKILIVDGDVDLARVLRSMLAEMGFLNCDTTSSGAEAYQMLKEEAYDFLITEWKLSQLDGLELIRKIRRAPDSPNPVLPIIMLTGRSEQVDVVTARDLGINEFVVKPFTAKTIYNRIERIIEHPREFVLAPNYVGPTRRSRGKPSKQNSDKRTTYIQPQLKPRDVASAVKNNKSVRVWLPDFSLKYKLGTNVKLENLITEAVLNQAQAAVDSISDASLGWVKDNLNDLRILMKLMLSGDYPSTIVHDIGELALTINSRAGTFGYSRASEIAYLLYLFCRNNLNPTIEGHRTTAQKHIDVLHVILGNQMRGDAGAMGQQLVLELKKLADKYSA